MSQSDSLWSIGWPSLKARHYLIQWDDRYISEARFSNKRKLHLFDLKAYGYKTNRSIFHSFTRSWPFTIPFGHIDGWEHANLLGGKINFISGCDTLIKMHARPLFRWARDRPITVVYAIRRANAGAQRNGVSQKEKKRGGGGSEPQAYSA